MTYSSFLFASYAKYKKSADGVRSIADRQCPDNSPVTDQATQHSQCPGYTAQPVPRLHSPASAQATQSSQCPGYTAQSSAQA
ncbi:MAG: hypothetical protein ACK55I_19370, partial [bacterium]